MKILFLTQHWAGNTHHSNYSGYQQIVYYAAKEHDCTIVTWGKENIIKHENGIEVHYVKPFMQRDYFFVKRLTISNYAKKMEPRFDVVHTLYSDCGYFQRHSNFFSTFHISPFVGIKIGFLSKLFLFLKFYIIEKSVFARSKKIIIVSTNLTKGLKKFKNKLVYIPHGINTDFWNPFDLNSAEKQECTLPYVLIVGNNGVDKKLLFSAIKENSDITFVLVGLRNFKCKLNNCKQLFNLSDIELKQLYKHCSVCIRPMNFATANNSILEALSMGKPVIISIPDGKYEYFGNFNEEIQVVKSIDFLNTLSFYLKKPDKPQGIIIPEVRNYALINFDWKTIWARTFEIYEAKA